MAGDETGAVISQALQTPGQLRDDLTTPGLFMPKKDEPGLGELEEVFHMSFQANGIIRKIRKAIKSGQLPKNKPERSVAEALSANVITKEEAELMNVVDRKRYDAIMVDSYTVEQYKAKDMKSPA